MDKRESLIEQFSTFIMWSEERFQRWQTDPRLSRHMEKSFQRVTSGDRQYWVAYWHQQWQQHNRSISRDHLYAYLQEPCYRVAVQLWSTYQHRHDRPLFDLFSQGVLCFQKLLTSFNPILNPNLGAYASFFLKWRILDELRRQDKSYGHTLWSLLLHTSETRVRKALIAMGINGLLLEYHLQAWDCYVELYKPAKVKREGKIQAPPPEIWAKIVATYNLLMPQPQNLETIQQWVNTSGQAVFRYMSPAEVSINQPLSTEGQQEFIDVTAAPDDNESPDSLLDYGAIYIQILAWLREEWQGLDLRTYRLNAHTKRIVQLYYGEGQEQKEISQQLGINQSTVSRTLNKVKTIVTDRFLEWSMDNLHISLQVNDVETINEAVSQWLWSIYQTQSGGSES